MLIEFRLKRVFSMFRYIVNFRGVNGIILHQSPEITPISRKLHQFPEIFIISKVSGLVAQKAKRFPKKLKIIKTLKCPWVPRCSVICPRLPYFVRSSTGLNHAMSSWLWNMNRIVQVFLFMRNGAPDKIIRFSTTRSKFNIRIEIMLQQFEDIPISRPIFNGT